jgi:hypothetical protein
MRPDHVIHTTAGGNSRPSLEYGEDTSRSTGDSQEPVDVVEPGDKHEWDYETIGTKRRRKRPRSDDESDTSLVPVSDSRPDPRQLSRLQADGSCLQEQSEELIKKLKKRGDRVSKPMRDEIVRLLLGFGKVVDRVTQVLGGEPVARRKSASKRAGKKAARKSKTDSEYTKDFDIELIDLVTEDNTPSTLEPTAAADADGAPVSEQDGQQESEPEVPSKKKRKRKNKSKKNTGTDNPNYDDIEVDQASDAAVVLDPVVDDISMEQDEQQPDAGPETKKKRRKRKGQRQTPAPMETSSPPEERPKRRTRSEKSVRKDAGNPSKVEVTKKSKGKDTTKPSPNPSKSDAQPTKKPSKGSAEDSRGPAQKSYAATASTVPTQRPVTQRVVIKTALANAAKRPPKGDFVLLVRSLDKTKTSEEINKLLKGVAKPDRDGFRPEKAVPVPGKRLVVVRLQDEASLRTLQNLPALTEAGLTLRLPATRWPLLRINGIPAGTPGDEVVASLSVASKAMGIEAGTPKAKFPLAKKGAALISWVVEVPPELRTAVLGRRGRISIGWDKCIAQDYVRLTRCYNCQRHGHVAKTCVAPQRCSRCAKEGHSGASCPSKGQPPRCANCASRRLPAVHAVTDPNCPCFIKAVGRSISAVPYGGS